MKKICLFIIVLSIIGCKNKTNTVNSTTEIFPRPMYVTFAEVYEYDNPSIHARKNKRLNRKEFVQVYGRQINPVTINGITGYWYRTSPYAFNLTSTWVFGAFLSEKLPQGEKDDITEIFPKLMYVVSKGEVNEYYEPSIDAVINKTLRYGQFVTVFGKLNNPVTINPVTINGITDYWYNTRFYENDPRWVFGGYLSEELPDDFPIIVGMWDDVNDDRVYYQFDFDFRYSEGYKGTGMGLFGTWKFNENIITINLLQAGTVQGATLDHIYDIQAIIIDKNNMELIFPQDSLYINKHKILSRNRSGD
jgi:hypothetical protein